MKSFQCLHGTDVTRGLATALNTAKAGLSCPLAGFDPDLDYSNIASRLEASARACGSCAEPLIA